MSYLTEKQKIAHATVTNQPRVTMYVQLYGGIKYVQCTEKNTIEKQIFTHNN